MNKQEIKDIFNSGAANDMKSRLEIFLFKRAIMTGSYAFFGGDPKDHFDIDFILMADKETGFTVHKLTGGSSGFYTGGDYNQEKFSSVYVKTRKYGNIPVNLILCHYGEEFEKWKLATAVMSSLLKSSTLFREKCKRDKDFRVTLFELCKKLKEE